MSCPETRSVGVSPRKLIDANCLAHCLALPITSLFENKVEKRHTREQPGCTYVLTSFCPCNNTLVVQHSTATIDRIRHHSPSATCSHYSLGLVSAMPAARTVFKQCKCEECLERDTNGIRIDARVMPAHLKRVQDERSRCKVDPSKDLAGHLFALTLTDDGPDPNATADKLWKSRAQYQKAGPSSDVVAGSLATLQISDITNSLSRLQLHDAPSAYPLIAHDTSSGTRPPGEPRTVSQSSSHPSTSIIAGRRLPKKDRHRCTVKALEILSNVEARSQRCSRLLLDNSNECIPSTIRQELELLRRATEGVKRDHDLVNSRKRDIIADLDKLEAQLRLHEPLESFSTDPVLFKIDDQHRPPVEHMDVVAQVATLIGVVCSVIMGVAERGGNFIMNALSLLLYLVFQRNDGTLSISHENVLRQIPSTMQSALSKFSLTSKVVPYAVCNCHCTYRPTYVPGSATPCYPAQCTNHLTPETICGEELLDILPNGERRPKKTYSYHDFNDYLANLLGRKEIETMMDQACDDLAQSLSSPLPRFVKNPFEAQFLRAFGGPETGKLFIDRGDEGRYAFALHVDFFNPEGMTQRGASTSSGIISMACLNLPLDVRYKPENMYLAGIIPGPKQPSLESLNHYIRPLIADLAVSWERGVRYSSTANHRNGRVTRSAIALVVCDLPAARHLAALAGTGSHFFCAACSCYHKLNYGRVDFENWVLRDKDKLRCYAEQWRDAPTSAERERLFKQYGVRYTELWRLPYWDPARQLVVDSMHCLLEGLVQHHMRTLLSLTTETTSPTQSTLPAFHYNFETLDLDVASSLYMTTKEVGQVSAIHALLVAQVPGDAFQVTASLEKLQDSLVHKNKSSLRYVCHSLGCVPEKKTRPFKVDYAKALVQWRTQQPLVADANMDIRDCSSKQALERIRSVIRTTAVPSWLGSVPKNFGDTSAGVIKADEWRSLVTVYIPIALISLWANPEAGLKPTLDHTMSLVSAIHLACARTMTVERASAYRQNIASYVKNLKQFYPTFNLRPNHHAAFHVYDYLLLFGPVHSWWTFPFERLIGVLQRLPSNHKSGELETSMLQSFLKGAKLRGWMSRSDCPPIIRECKVLLDRAYRTPDNIDNDGDEVGVPTSKATNIPEDLHALIGQRKAVMRARLKHSPGVYYCQSSTHVGNSLILFYPQGNQSLSPVPGSIKFIYESEGSWLFAVQRQRPLTVASTDPYAAYPHFPAKLYSPVLEEKLETVRVAWAVGHYARWTVSSEHAVVLSLCRD